MLWLTVLLSKPILKFLQLKILIKMLSFLILAPKWFFVVVGFLFIFFFPQYLFRMQEEKYSELFWHDWETAVAITVHSLNPISIASVILVQACLFSSSMEDVFL